MIPPSMQQQQAMRAQQAMQPRPNPADALLQALSAQAAQGEMMKETAQYKMKMIKLKMKYSGQPMGPQGPMGGQGPQGVY
jgi:hypothetical protein